MLVCVLLCAFARETAGAARTRLSLRPRLAERVKSDASLGHLLPRECGLIPSRCLKIESENAAIVSRSRANQRCQFARMARNSDTRENALRKGIHDPSIIATPRQTTRTVKDSSRRCRTRG